MGFWRQVFALMRKDARIAIANKAASLVEIIVPIVIGCMVGLFIMLIQIVQGQAGEYSDLKEMPEPWTSVGAMFGMSNKELSAATLSLSQYYAKYFAPGLFLDNFTTAHELLSALQTSQDGGFGLAARNNNNATFYLNVSESEDWIYGVAGAVGKDLISSQSAAAVKISSTFEYTGVSVNLRAIFSSTGTTFMIYAFLPALVLTAGRLAEEKRSRVRESLKVMGVGDMAYVLSNYLSTVIRLTIGSGLTTVVPAFFSAYDLSDIPAVFGISILFVLSLISYAHLMASIFSLSMWTNVGCIILLALGAAIASLSTGWPLGLEYLTCLLSPAAFYYALLPYMTRGTVQLQLSTRNAVMMLVIDTILYGLLGNYIYQISPGDFGVPKHPLFFLNFSKILSTKKKRDTTNLDDAHLQANNNDVSDRIVLENLVKYYGTQKEVASVDHLSLNIRKGEIFALLGHNGAGKTTTISILTGMITATEYGEATIDGVDIHEGMDTIRKSVGLCPQFDVLFGDLSARQHLELFAEIKGLDRNCERVQTMMKQLDLPDTPQKASTFSGGTKRRLSVGNALVGDPTLVFLDEPSSGMDPLSRRKMWDLIKDERNRGKTVVLTTHFMEEADYLGDRIAIMAAGKLFCCNTSGQLKEQYGVGYYLIFAKEEGKIAQTKEMLELVQKHIPNTKFHHESSGDSTFLVSLSAISSFPTMLRDVEENYKSYNFHSFGVAMNTLEDVFVSISERVEEEKAKKSGKPASAQHTTGKGINADNMLINGELPEVIFQKGLRVDYWSRARSQTATIFMRKLTMLGRNRRMQLMVIVFPIVFIVLAFATLQPTAPNSDQNFVSLTLPNYNDLHVVNVDLRDHDDNRKIRDAFQLLYSNRYPGSTLTVFDIHSYNDYASGQYLPLKSVSFASGFNSPDIACGLVIHSVDLSEGYANYSFVVNNKFSAEAFVDLHQMYVAAINMAAGHNVSTVSVEAGTIPFIINHNATLPPQVDVNDPKLKTYTVIQVGIYLVIAIVQLASNVAVPMADEINRQIYHVSRAQGLLPIAFFAGNFLFDLLCAVIPVIVLGLAILIAGIPAYHNFGVLLAVLLAAFMFCVHAILDSYVLVAYVRNWKPVAYTGLLHAVNLAMFGAPYLVSVIIGAASDATPGTYKPWLLSLTPPASFYHIMDNAADMNYYTSSPSYILTLTGDVATGWGYLFLLAEYTVPIFLLYKFAKGDWPRDRDGAAPPPPKKSLNEGSPLLDIAAITTEQPLDPDVLAERKRVDESPSDYAVALSHVVKKFGQKVAVNDLSLGIRNGDCFGLLGPNGAGKTTTCHMILRCLTPSQGNVLFPGSGVDSSTPHQEAYDAIRMGMCTQGDTLWEYLTNVEHMEQFLRLRLTTAYKEEDWKTYIRNTIDRVQLDHKDPTHAGGYSGGMKRKLTVCLAMYTGSKLVFLDEPSTGMDPFARRALWSVILEALSNDLSVLLTTHSMEEADAVCGRISIITSGQLRCIGSSQHLKGRFGSGYVLTLLHEIDANPLAIDQYVAEAFGFSGVPNEVLGLQRRYDLGKLNSLAEAFETMQKKKEELRLVQYSISQTVSLEQIFLTFVGESGEPSGLAEK